MRKLFTLLCLLFSAFAFSQSVVPLRGDTIKIYKSGGTAELVLLNTTKDSVNGFLQNMGNGRTEFHTLLTSGFLINPMTSPNDMIRGGTAGVPTRLAAPAHAGMKLGFDGTVLKWYDTTAAAASPAWGSITGLLSNQTDLQTALNAKQNTIALGTTLQYFRGDLSLATFPTNLSAFTNGPGYLTTVLDTNSIIGTGVAGSKLQLAGDVASPGATKFYGTDGGGAKGWYVFPVASSAITQLTGDGSAVGPGSVGFTLATVNANVFGSNTFLKHSVNAKGLITSAAAVTSLDVSTALGFTSLGDLMVGSGSNAAVRLGVGSTNQVLTVIAGTAAWVTPASGFSDPLTTNGDIIARISGVTTRLPQGTNGLFLGVSGGVLGYFTPPSGFADPLTTNGDIIARIGGVTTRLPKGANNTVANIDGSGLLNYALLTNANLSGTAGITNANLANPAITINGTSVSLGGTINVGTVLTVSGTTNRITSTGGNNPVIDISATFEALLGKVANPLSQFAATTSAQLAGVLSNETGTSLAVFNTSPLFVTPRLSATSTTGYVWTATDAIGNGSFQASTGGAGLDTGVTVNNTILKTVAGTTMMLKVDTTLIATRAYINNLADTFYLDKPGVGTGAIPLAFTNAGRLVIPNWAPGTNVSFSVGSDSLVTINFSGVTGTVLSVSGTLNRITSTGGANPILNISATFEALLGKVANPLSQFAATTSAQLAGVLSDETGTGLAVFATSPLFTTPRLGATSTIGQAWIATDVLGNGSFQNLPSGFADPMTTAYDIIYRNGSNVTARLPKGANNTVLLTDGSGVVGYNLLTNANLSGTAGISNANLANSSITIDGNVGSLGGTVASNPALTSTQIGVGNGSNRLSGSSSLTFSGNLLHMPNIDIKWDNGSEYFGSRVPTGSLLQNTVVGSSSFNTAATGQDNSFFGNSVAPNITTGVSNSGFGRSTFAALTTGSNNFGMGANSLILVTTGSKNIAVGYSAGKNINTTSGNNIVIGSDSSASAAVVNNYTFIGNGYTTYRSNTATFGRADQVVSLGKGGMSTAFYTSLSTIATAGDIYYNTDTADYIRFNGSIWRGFGIGGGGGGGSPLYLKQNTSAVRDTTHEGLEFRAVNFATTEETQPIIFYPRATDTSASSLQYFPLVFKSRKALDGKNFGDFSIQSVMNRLALQTGPDNSLRIGYGLQGEDSSRSNALVFEANYRQGGQLDSARQFETYFESFVNDGHGTVTSWRPWGMNTSRTYRHGYHLFHGDSYSFSYADNDTGMFSLDNTNIKYYSLVNPTFYLGNARTNQAMTLAMSSTNDITWGGTAKLDLAVSTLILGGSGAERRLLGFSQYGIPYITTASGFPALANDPTNFAWNYANHSLDLGNNAFINMSSTGTSGTYFTETANYAGNGLVNYVRNTSTTGYARSLIDNDRGSFGSYLDIIYAGSAATALNGTLGQNPSADWGFVHTGGASNAGLGVGTSGAAPLVLGTNNTERLKISSAGVWTIPSSNFANGGTSDSVIVESTSGGVMTLKKVAQASLVGATAGIDAVLAIGQALTANRTIATGANTLTVSTSTSAVTPFKVTSTTGNAFQASTTGGLAANYIVNSATGNTVVSNLQVTRQTSGTPANGIGSSIDFLTSSTAGAALSTTLESSLTDATTATQTSQFKIKGVNNGGASSDLFTLAGSGALRLNGYSSLTTQNDTTTYKPMGIDGSGNVKKMDGWTGGGGGGGMSNPMTTTGDMIYSSSGSTPARLPVGSTDAILTVAGGIPAWGPVVKSASYTPTLTNTANITTSSNNTASYIRVGNVVTVTVSVNITCTANTTSTQLTVTLPITTATTTQGAIGSITGGQGSSPPAIGLGSVASTTTILFTFISVNSGSADIYNIRFQYQL